MSTSDRDHLRTQSESNGFVRLTCPKCGYQIGVRAAAYIGGWCVGDGMKRHRPINLKVVTDE